MLKKELIDLIESKGSLALHPDRSLLDDPVPDIYVPVLVPIIAPRMIKTAANKVKTLWKNQQKLSSVGLNGCTMQVKISL